MARIVFTPIRSKKYRAVLSQAQDIMQDWQEYIRTSPGAKSFWADAIAKFTVRIGLATVNNSASVPVGDATAVANGQDNGTATVTAAGAITRVTLPSTDKIIKSTVKYTGPAITGSYVNGYTFTIVAGAITAIVAS